MDSSANHVSVEGHGYAFVSLNLALEINKKVLKIPGKLPVHYSVL